MDIAEIRRKNLAALVDKYTLAGAGRKFKKPDRQLGDMIAGRKSFGEKVATQMEKNYAPNHPLGWLSNPVTIDPDDSEYKFSDPASNSNNDDGYNKDARLAFAERLIEICTEKGLKAHGRQAALARQLKVTQPAVKKWFDGDSIPDTDKIIDLAIWGNVCFEWLTTGRGPKRIDELYPTKAIAHVAEIMQTMEPEQQYLVVRLADQVAKPAEEDELTGTHNQTPKKGEK